VQNRRNDEAIALLDRVAADANAPHFDDAEGLRVRACARLAQGAPLAEVEALLQRGLATARRQHARLFELRTATSLAQIWRDAGRMDDAHAVLSPIYGWFTSGHKTPDLIQAHAVLDSMK
jgi:predicted ATPase